MSSKLLEILFNSSMTCAGSVVFIPLSIDSDETVLEFEVDLSTDPCLLFMLCRGRPGGTGLPCGCRGALVGLVTVLGIRGALLPLKGFIVFAFLGSRGG